MFRRDTNRDAARTYRSAPKHVVGSAAATLHRLRWQWNRFPFDKDDVVLRRAPAVFVDAVAEILGASLGGAALRVSNADDIVEAARGATTRVGLTPSLLASLLRRCPKGVGAALPRVRLWLASGEALPRWVVKAFAAGAAPGQVLANARRPRGRFRRVIGFRARPEPRTAASSSRSRGRVPRRGPRNPAGG